MLKKKNDSRKRFVDMGLENVAVAVARVTERAPRCSNKEGKKRRVPGSALARHTFNSPWVRQNLSSQAMFREYIYVYIFVFI